MRLVPGSDPPRPPRWRATRGPRRRAVSLAAVVAALAVSVTMSAIAASGGRGERVPTEVPTFTAAARIPEATLVRELGRLRVDLTVAQATWAGTPQDARDRHPDLAAEIDDVARWLAAHDPVPVDADGDDVLRGVADHRDRLARVLEVLAQVRATTTPTPTPRATPPVTPRPPAPPRRPARVPDQPAPEPTPTEQGGPAPVEPAPTAAPAPTTPPAPTAPAATAPPTPSPSPAPPAPNPDPQPSGEPETSPAP